jgi:DNA-binding NarL/FixJ family response regulator
MMALGKNSILSAAAWAKLAKGMGMSPRQEQIANCVFMGFGDKEIAEEIGVSVPTVRTHMGRLFNKLDVDDRVKLVLVVMRRYCQDYCPHRQ